jgi:hypothetical protein
MLGQEDTAVFFEGSMWEHNEQTLKLTIFQNDILTRYI